MSCTALLRTTWVAALVALAAGVFRREAGELQEHCGRFLSSFEDGDDGSFQDDGQWLGTTGGAWSPCTHLGAYGLNFAPFFGRFLAYQLAPKTALEFGCGLGTTSDFIARSAGATVTCIEPEKTLAALISTLRRDNMGNGHLRQLAINIFDNDTETATCRASIAKHDLVVSLEVAEHIPVEFHPQLIDFLVRSTGKWLVFSAARPEQGGTGHLPESMFTREEWVAKFEKAGLQYMHNLTQLARLSSYPIRGYDLYANTIVLKNPAYRAAEETFTPHEMLAHFMYGGFDKERFSRMADANLSAMNQMSHAFAHGSNAAMWPTLTLLEQKAQKRLICQRHTPAKEGGVSLLQQSSGAASTSTSTSAAELPMESAWAWHFYQSALTRAE